VLRAYRWLLRRRRARWQAGAGLLAQITQGAGAVGIVLVIKQQSGSLALAGATVGVTSIAAAVARPFQGRMIDTRGSALVMAGCGVVHPAALAGVVLLAGAHAPAIAVLVSGALAGLALPPVSTSMRVVWGEAAGSDQRISAYSLTYLIQELAILAGPLLLAAVTAISSASAAVLVVATVAGLATLAYAATVRGSPAGPRQSGGTRVGVFGSVAVRALVAIAFLLGGVIGAVEVAAPVFALSHHAPAAGGLLVAALSAGGIIGAVVYGSRTFSRAASTRLIVLLGTLTASVALGSLAGAPIVAGVLLLVVGVCLNPALTTISLLVDEHTPGRTAAEAFGWLSSGFAAGGGAASAIAGLAAGHHRSATAAFLVAALSGGVATGLAMIARGALSAPTSCQD
jgi:MFS family permease